jgi:hypothetical protein
MPCFYAHAGESVEAEGFKKEPEQIITAHIRKFYRTRERRPVAAPRDCGRLRQEPTWHPLLRVRFAAFAGFRSAHVRFKARRASAVQRAGHCPKPLERLAVYWFPEKAVYPLTVNME